MITRDFLLFLFLAALAGAEVPPAPVVDPEPGEEFATKGRPDKQREKRVAEYYQVDTIPMPPGLSAEVGGMSFLPDGRLAVCFHRGEVYFYDPAKKTWSLFAEGLHDPLGVLAVSSTEILVMQRPELTRLRDTDGDGTADEYQTVTDDFGLTGNYHEFAFGPVRDAAGNLYLSLNVASSGAGIRHEVRGERNPRSLPPARMYSAVPWRGWVMKLTPEGKLTPFASGFRSPNGLGFDAAGNLYVTDNQGDWLGSSHLYHVQAGKFYGHVASLAWKEGEQREPLKIPPAELEAMRTRPSVVFPQGTMANSPTQPLLDDTGGKFGPFSGQMLVGEYTRSRLMRLMLETVDGQIQGACIPLIDAGGTSSGNNRLAFAPDGSLWVGHTTHGWGGTNGLQRIAWKGKLPLEVKEMHLTKEGFELTFTQPVQKESAEQVKNYRFKRYFYQYWSNYGGPQTDVQDVPVTRATLSADGLCVNLQLADLTAWRVYQLDLGEIKSTAGELPLNSLICYTLNHLLEGTPPPPAPPILSAKSKPAE